MDVKSLKASDLDQLAVLIADALQVVDQQAGQGEMPRDLETQQKEYDQDQEYEDQEQHSESEVDQIPEDSAQKQNNVDEENVSVTQKTLQTVPPVTGNT